jgi:hypothetical protein
MYYRNICCLKQVAYFLLVFSCAMHYYVLGKKYCNWKIEDKFDNLTKG